MLARQLGWSEGDLASTQLELKARRNRRRDGGCMAARGPAVQVMPGKQHGMMQYAASTRCDGILQQIR